MGWVSSIQVDIEPYGLLTNGDGSKLYVVNYRSSTLSVVDLTKSVVIQTIKVDENPRGLSTTADGSKLYITHYLSGKISVLNTYEDKVKKVLALFASPDKEDRKKSQGIPNTLEQISLSPDGKTAWISHLLTNTDTPIHFEETVFSAISVIDTEKDEELKYYGSCFECY